MAKSVRQPVTLGHLAKMVERGFADVRSELSKKADKTDIVALGGEIKDLRDDLEKLARSTKLGFDTVHRELELKASAVDLEVGFEFVKQRLSNLDNRLDTFVTHEKRLVQVEKAVGIAA